jgi:DNA-binding MarR family transcriptional regulator
MVSTRVLRSDLELKAYLHRARMRILAEMRNGAATVSQVAERLGVHPANLSRHVRVLEQAGLIERLASAGGVEKFYRVTADVFEVAPDRSAHEAAHAIALGLARSDLSAALANLSGDDPRVAAAFLARANVTQETARTFARELRALADRFKAAEGDDGEAYHVNLSLYPGGGWDGPKGPIELKKKDDEAEG